VASCGLTETIEKAGKASRWTEKSGNCRLPWHWHRLQLRTDRFPMESGRLAGLIKLNEDGGVTVITGIVDNGQGNDHMIVQIAAEELD